MKHALPFIFLLAQPLCAATSPDWITETPLEFITTGRFQTTSDGTDLLVVDKASGLARIGLQSGGDLHWIEQSTGMSAITGLTTLRQGAVDQIVVSSSDWNAVQRVTVGESPQTLRSPVIGPKALFRLSTGHAAAAVVEDIVTLSSLGIAPDPEEMAAMTETGTPLFTLAAPGLPTSPQFIPLSSATGLPVLVSVRGNQLRVDRLSRAGSLPGSLDISGPHPAGLHWTAGPQELFNIAKDDVTLEQHRMASATDSPGFTVPSGVALVTGHLLPEQVLSLDAVPFVDPAYPALQCLVAIRFVSTPDSVRLYRFLDTPLAIADELTVLYMPVGESFAGLVSLGDDFLLLSGPGGRVKSWKRYAQPAPGQLPSVIASGSLPALRTRAANPNIFIFNQDPFLTNQAILTASQSQLDWTTLTDLLTIGESDGGITQGLGAVQTITVNAAGGVPIGNQLLPEASVAGFGPVAGLQRPSVIFQPAAGAYAALDADEVFPITLRSTVAGSTLHYRISGTDTWTLYDASEPPELHSDGSLSAYATDPDSGMRSPIVTAAYTFAALPPANPAAALDANNNGLSDAWERAFGITDPNSDTDGDGFNALTEQNYGSDPLDAGSRPPGGSTPEADIAVASAQAGNITLAWPDGLVGYILEYSPDLTTWYPVSPQPLDNHWSEPISGQRKFYRLRKL